MYTLDACFLLKQIVKNYFANAINSYGFSPGDFHQSNIMIDFNKNLKLIDLDSIRLNGIQDFDALHFVLEHFWAKNSIHWSESISNLIINQSQGEFQDYLNSFSIQGSNGLT